MTDYSEPPEVTLADRRALLTALLEATELIDDDDFHPEVDETLASPEQYALVEENARWGGRTWVTTHPSLLDLERYCRGERDDGWVPRAVVDLDTGDTLTPELRLTFAPHDGRCLHCHEEHEEGDEAFVGWCDRHDRCAVVAQCHSGVVVHSLDDDEPPSTTPDGHGGDPQQGA